MVYLVYCLLCVAVGFWAQSWGRSGFLFALLSLLLSPLVGALVLLFRGKNSSINPITGLPLGVSARKCPECAEFIKVEAVRCKHCGASVPQDAVN